MRIAVIGGGGMIGSRIVQEALDRGHDVTCLVRSPQASEAPERLAVVRGDALDPDLAGRLEGHEVVVSAVGTARADDPDYSVYRRAAESLVGALRGLGEAAPRLIVVGGCGSLREESGRLLLERVPEERLPEHLGQKESLDFYRTVSDVSWTYVSPPARIAPGERTGSYRVGEDELVVDGNGVSDISMEDYGVAIVDEAETERHVGRRFTVGY